MVLFPTTKVRVSYLYRHAWKEKCLTLNTLSEWIREGKYVRRVNAVRGLEYIRTEIGDASGPAAAENLPCVFPSKGEKDGYTGLVLLSFRITEGQDALEQLRKHVNLWEQTLLSFAGSSGQSLKVLIPYRLTGGNLPDGPSQTSLFQQFAYKRAAEYALASTSIRPEEVRHDGTEHFRISYDPQVYLNPDAKPIEMEQPTEPLTERNADYYETPNVIFLFEDHFRRPLTGDERLLLSPTELLGRLGMDKENQSNATLLGNYLRRNSFEKGTGSNRRRYYVTCTA